MLRNLKKKVAVLSCTVFIIGTLATSAVAAIPVSYIYADGKTYVTGQKVEFLRENLASSKARGGPMYTQYLDIVTGQMTEAYNFNNSYYNRTELASKYARLSGTSKTLDNAIAQVTPVSLATRIAKESTLSGTKLNYFEGPVATSTSSLSFVRVTGTDNWNVLENTSYAGNPIGQLKFVFSKNIDKSSVDKIKVYLNGAATEPEGAATIKTLLFGEFVDRELTGTATNELSADIAFTYSDLKTLLNTYNNGSAVTSVKIEGISTETTPTAVSITLNIQ